MYLTFDLGGSSLRAGLVGSDGALLARATRPTRGVEAWWSDVQACAVELAALAPLHFAAVQAIAVSAMTRTQVLVDASGNAVGPAIGFADTRAAETLAELLAKLPADDGETAQINAYHPLARLYWLARAEPQRLAATARVLDPKDYLNAKLTGTIASDPISLSRLAACRPALMGAAGLDAALLPPLAPPLSVLGVVRAGHSGAFGSLAGVPVVTMAHDTWASVLGLGALRPGFAYNLSGTTEVFGLCTDVPATAPGLLTVEWGPRIHQIGGPSLAGGDTVRWLQDVLADDAVSDALAADAGALPLLFLPYLSGERVPHWDPALRGAWVGLDRRHGRRDLVRAVLQGVAHLNRLVLERAESAANRRAVEVRFGGGGAVNAAWCQIKADILQRPVVVTEVADHGLVGAAVAACAALGTPLEVAQSRMVRVARRYEPAANSQAHADTLHRLYRQAETALAPISRELSRLADGQALA